MEIDYYEVVKKLVGPIDPIGETQEDDRRLGNLEIMTYLIDRLLRDIDNVAMKDNCTTASIRKAAKCASDFFDHLGIYE